MSSTPASTLGVEQFVIARMHERGATWRGQPIVMLTADGVTEPHQRLKRMREAILSNALSNARLGRYNGRDETYAQWFERFYREPL